MRESLKTRIRAVIDHLERDLRQFAGDVTASIATGEDIESLLEEIDDLERRAAPKLDIIADCKYRDGEP